MNEFVYNVQKFAYGCPIASVPLVEKTYLTSLNCLHYVKNQLSIAAPGWAHAVKRLILGFGSGHDLTVHEFEPYIRLCADSVEPSWNPLFSLSLPFPCSCSPSLSQINNKLKKESTGHICVDLLLCSVVPSIDLYVYPLTNTTQS